MADSNEKCALWIKTIEQIIVVCDVFAVEKTVWESNEMCYLRQRYTSNPIQTTLTCEYPCQVLHTSTIMCTETIPLK